MPPQPRTPRKRTTAKPPATAQPLTFADIQARIKRPRRIAEVVLDAEAAAQIDNYTELLERAQARDAALGGKPVAPDIARLLMEAEQRADDSRVQLVFEAIPHTRYRELQTKHPTTPEQQAELEQLGAERWPFNADTFAPALVKAQMVDPLPGTDEEFAAFWAALSDGQIQHLWTTALGVQMQITTLAPRSEAAADVIRAIAGS